MKILVTGTAGFIGSTLAKRLLERGDEVVGVDNVNDYYDVSLKYARLDRLKGYDGFKDVRLDIQDKDGMAALFAKEKPQRVPLGWGQSLPAIPLLGWGQVCCQYISGNPTFISPASTVSLLDARA